ncbi:hypothetical protein [Noviluteimonas gilva]|uniref:Uncharacterized protein n=1 Tax=Noviluteimonas gilva TaxID=2682097 RepID=A0A7C9MLC2_9GAMM|nr:hypothetical protein [Lysobacter gilvus]MUV13407.1 hypothetical protein [Lysobacter gilvus]
MRASRWWLSGLIVVAGPAFAGDPPPPMSPQQLEAELCGNPQRPCQRDVHIVLKQADGTTFDRTYPVFQPILHDTFFTVVPGQTVYIEAELVDGKVRATSSCPMTGGSYELWSEALFQVLIGSGRVVEGDDATVCS